jgi:rhamnosyltransferase
MGDNIRISACIVLYNPGENIFSNIFLNLTHISHLYIIDNSESSGYGKVFEKENITYIKNTGNKGVAFALNQAANLAIADGFKYLLTLDQDSTLDIHFVNQFINYLNSNNTDFLGLLSPHYLYEKYSNPPKMKRNHPIRFTMTSGSLLNLEAYKKGGPFLDELFIDYIDIEYCLRLRKKGYDIIKIHDAYLYHNLGSIQGRKFLFRKISVTNHSPLRLFYRTRNRFFVYKLYIIEFPGFVVTDLIIFINELIKIIFYEKNKIEKYKWIVKGFCCFLNNKMGKYES